MGMFSLNKRSYYVLILCNKKAELKNRKVCNWWIFIREIKWILYVKESGSIKKKVFKFK